MAPIRILRVVFSHDVKKGPRAREYLVQKLKQWRAEGNTSLSLAELGTFGGVLALLIATPEPLELENKITTGLTTEY